MLNAVAYMSLAFCTVCISPCIILLSSSISFSFYLLDHFPLPGGRISVLTHQVCQTVFGSKPGVQLWFAGSNILQYKINLCLSNNYVSYLHYLLKFLIIYYKILRMHECTIHINILTFAGHQDHRTLPSNRKVII